MEKKYANPVTMTRKEIGQQKNRNKRTFEGLFLSILIAGMIIGSILLVMEKLKLL